MNSFRWTVTVILLSVTGAALYKYVWLPLSCVRAVPAIEAQTMAAAEDGDDYRRLVISRKALRQAERCIACLPLDVNLRMLAGANMQLSGRYEDAVAIYSGTLKIHRRPEIYLNLGTAQLRANPSSVEGFNNIMKGVRFDPPLLDSLNDPSIKARAEQELERKSR